MVGLGRIGVPVHLRDNVNFHIPPSIRRFKPYGYLYCGLSNNTSCEGVSPGG